MTGRDPSRPLAGARTAPTGTGGRARTVRLSLRRASRLLLLMALLTPLVTPLPTPLSCRPAAAGPDSGRLPARSGLQDLLLAGQLLQQSHAFARASAPEATLALKREALLDRAVIRALSLLKEGLSQEIVAPPGPIAPQQSRPELTAFPNLGRLLQLQLYVYLADGRNPEALRTARTALRLGRAVRTDGLLTGIAGMALTASCVRSLGSQLDRLSAPDCEMLFQLCREWLAEGDPLPSMLAGERKTSRALLEKMRAETLKEPGAKAEEVTRHFDGMRERLDAFYAELLERVQQPPWARPPLPAVMPGDEDLGSALVASLIPAFQRALDTSTRELAQVRLLACHAALRRFRWENERLPGSLDELGLGELGVDPFTGTAFHYEPRGARYRLFSAGPKAAAEEPGAVNGRKPLFVTPEE